MLDCPHERVNIGTQEGAVVTQVWESMCMWELSHADMYNYGMSPSLIMFKQWIVLLLV